MPKETKEKKEKKAEKSYADMTREERVMGVKEESKENK